MTLHEFSLLPKAQKTAFLYQRGVYIGKRRLGGSTVLLYQLDGFYAEIYYRHYRRVIERMDLFADTDRLDPYLTEISVADLV